MLSAIHCQSSSRDDSRKLYESLFNQFSTGNSPFQLVQCSIVPNKKKKTANMWITHHMLSNYCNVTGLLRLLQVNIQVFKIIKWTWRRPLKTGFAQISSRCPKNLSCPNFGGGAAAPLAPPARTPMTRNMYMRWWKCKNRIRLPRTSNLEFVAYFTN